MKKTMKFFGLGASVLMILTAIGSVTVNAGGYADDKTFFDNSPDGGAEGAALGKLIMMLLFGDNFEETVDAEKDDSTSDDGTGSEPPEESQDLPYPPTDNDGDGASNDP